MKKLLKLFFILLVFFVGFFYISPKNTEAASCLNIEGPSYESGTFSLPSVNDTITVKVRFRNLCTSAIPEPTFSYYFDLKFSVDGGNQSFFTQPGWQQITGSIPPGGYSPYFSFTTTVKAGNTCTTSASTFAQASIIVIDPTFGASTVVSAGNSVTAAGGVGASLTGVVYNPDGTTRAGGATVSISPTDGSIGTTTADGNGNYSFSRINCTINHTLSASSGPNSNSIAIPSSNSNGGANVCNGQSRQNNITLISIIPPPPTVNPTSQACQADNSVTANLSWNASNGATGYRVYKWTGACWADNNNQCDDRNGTRHNLYDGPSTSYSWQGLVQGNGYTWGVTAYNGSGETDPVSAFVGFGAITCPPPQIDCTSNCTVNTCVVKEGTPARLSWPRPAGATSFQIRVNDTTANGWNGSCNGGELAGDKCIDNYVKSGDPVTYDMTIIPGHDYNWWVHACGPGGCNAQSNGNSFQGNWPAKLSCGDVPAPLPGNPSGKYGDVDGDLYVSCLDAKKIAEIGAGLFCPNSAQIEKADVDDTPGVSSVWNCSTFTGDISIVDAQWIGKYLNNTLSNFSVCAPPPVCTNPNKTPVGFCDGGVPPQYCQTANSNTVPNCDGSKGSPSCPCPAGQVCKNDGTGTCATPTPTPTGTPPTTYSISGTIFIDDGAGGGTANDGIKQAGESVYSPSVNMSVDGGSSISRTLTGGVYTIPSLAGNTTHTINLSPPSGYAISKSGTSPNTNPRTVSVPLANVSNINFGIISAVTAPPPTTPPLPAYIQGIVYSDLDADGVRDAGEPGVNSGGTNLVYAYQVSTSESVMSCSPAPPTYTSSSSADGSYNITLPSGGPYNYKIMLHNPPIGYTFLPPGWNGTCLDQCSVSSSIGQCINISAGQFYLDIPMRPLYDISGAIYIDENNNGVWECVGTCDDGAGDEPSYRAAGANFYIDGSTSQTYTSNQNPQATDPYIFKISDFLGNQTHTLRLAAPSGYVISNNGINPNTNPRPVTITTSNVVNINFGIIRTGFINPDIYIDSNNNGIKDGGEGWQSGVTYTYRINGDQYLFRCILSGSWTCNPYNDLNGNGAIDCSGACDNIPPDEPIQEVFKYPYTSSGIDYTVELVVPSGYVMSKNGAPPNTNPRTSTLNNTLEWESFGIVSTDTTISGKCIVDNPPYSSYGANDTSLGGSYTISYSNTNGTVSGTSTCNDGTFPPIRVPPGEYTISYPGSPPPGYEVSFPPNLIHIVTVGPACDVGASSAFGASCVTSGTDPAPGSVIGLNFGFKPPGQWIQTSGTDIRFDNGLGGLETTIPSTASPSVCVSPFGNLFTSVNVAGGSPGIIFTGDTPADFGAGSASAPNWKVGSSSYPDFYTPSKGIYTTSYAYVSGRVKQSGITPASLCSANLNNCTILSSLASGVYEIDASGGDTTLTSATIGNGKKYIILVKGNLIIKSNIIVPIGSSLTFIVSGNIHIDKSVGTTWNSAVTQVEGFYSADGSFFLDGEQNSCLTADNRLNMAGSIIVNAGKTTPAGQFVDNRTLCTNNAFCPVFTISERPDFILNAPESIKQIKTIYQEVAP